jgi:Ice-binding-like/Bacterial Ig-like domain
MKKPPFGTESTLLPACKRFSEIFHIKWFMLAYLFVFAAGCKKVTEEKGLTGVCPMVISTSPADTATGISLNTTINATFNEVMDSSTIDTSTFTLKQGTTVITGVVTYTGKTATFSPSGNLLPNTTYTGTITTGVRDPAHDALISNYVWAFTTFQTLQSAAPPSFLGSASVFGVFGGSAGTTNQGLNTVINNGGIGTTGAPTLITGFHDGMTGDIYTQTLVNVGDVTGGIYTGPPAPGTPASFIIATNALADANSAYDSISPASRPGGTDPGAGELGGLTLIPGIYKSASATFTISSGNLTLDAKGDSNAVWIFQTTAALTVGIAGPAGARSVIMINGGSPKNVYWYVGSAATINGAGGGVMVGTIIASAGVTFSTAGNTVQTVLNGRALSLNASVTMVNTTINVP